MLLRAQNVCRLMERRRPLALALPFAPGDFGTSHWQLLVNAKASGPELEAPDCRGQRQPHTTVSPSLVNGTLLFENQWLRKNAALTTPAPALRRKTRSRRTGG